MATQQPRDVIPRRLRAGCIRAQHGFRRRDAAPRNRCARHDRGNAAVGLLWRCSIPRDESQPVDALLKNGIGHVSALGLVGHKTTEVLAQTVNAVQRYLVTETRLKIPAIFHNEAMSGVVAPHFTAFPTSIGLAATWDPAAMEEMADIIRRQMRAVGLLQALAPVMDVARDARWGRVRKLSGRIPI